MMPLGRGGPHCHEIVSWIALLIAHSRMPSVQPDLLDHEKRQVICHAEWCAMCQARLQRSGREDVLDILFNRLSQQG